MKKIRLSVPMWAIGTFLFSCFGDHPGNEEIWTCHNAESVELTVYDAAGDLPQGAPQRSDEFSGISFTGKFANYTKADTWYPTWASDGNLYSPWTDGSIAEVKSAGWVGKDATWGYAKISGDDPLHLVVADYGVRTGSAHPYGGRYPCGSLHYNGVWYYGTYGLDQSNNAVRKKFGWYNLGPLIGFAVSEDNGKTWTDSAHSPSAPLFDEAGFDQLDRDEGQFGPFIKMGAPHFVDFGQNMEYSADGKAYLVGHGAADDDPMPRVANNSWVTGDAIYLARVTPGIGNMNDRTQYEFFAGYDAAGNAMWVCDFTQIMPVFEWNNHAGIVTATYNPVLNKYFMCITNGHIGRTTRKEYTSYIMESDQLTGPWKMIAHLPQFGPQAYFLNIPSKFISDDGKTMWLCSSSNYMAGDKTRNDPEYVRKTTPPGCAYSLSLQEFRLNE